MGNKNTVYLTQEGLEELKKELDNLINVKLDHWGIYQKMQNTMQLVTNRLK